jgi:hypothetical protein
MNALLLLLVAMAPAAPVTEATAAAGPLKGLALSLDVYGLHRFDEGYRLFGGSDDDGAGGLEASYDLVHIGEGARLALGLGVLIEARNGQPEHDSVAQLALEATSPYVTAILRWRPTRALQPYVALAGGITWATLTLDPDRTALEAKARSLFGRVSAGARLQPAALVWRRAGGTPVLGLAFSLEVGATAGTPLELSLTGAAAGGTGDDHIAVDPVPVGTLEQTGAFARLMLMVVF